MNNFCNNYQLINEHLTFIIINYRIGHKERVYAAYLRAQAKEPWDQKGR